MMSSKLRLISISLWLMIVAGLISLNLVPSVDFVWAQTEPVAEEAEPMPVQAQPEMVDPNQIFDRVNVDPEIAALQQQYQQDFAKYRDLDRQFVIAKQQFQQLQTLLSLETAIQATKQVMLARNQVLQTYFKLLKLHLVNSSGVNLSQKNQAITKIDGYLTALDAHQQRVSVASQREDIDQLATEFATLSAGFESQSQLVQGLLIVGKLQTIHDKLRTFIDEFSNQKISELSEQDQLKKAQVVRAVGETNKVLATANQRLATSVMSLQESDSPGRASYGNIQKDVAEAYAHLSQVLAYVREIKRL